MAEVKVGENESIESALRRFKKKIQKAGILSEVKKRERYEKPSVKRKRKSEAARKRKVQRYKKGRQKSSFFYLKIIYMFYLQIGFVYRRIISTATWPSGKAEACKAFIPQFESGCRLFIFIITSQIKKNIWKIWN